MPLTDAQAETVVQASISDAGGGTGPHHDGKTLFEAVAASWLLPTLANGKTPGERLAAIAFLQMQPNPSYIGWLGERFRKEQPFLMYHAAFALKNASEGLRREHWTAIKNAIDTAKELSKQDETVQRILGFAEQTLGTQP
jgi:hypothetical protein